MNRCPYADFCVKLVAAERYCRPEPGPCSKTSPEVLETCEAYRIYLNTGL